jgi:hypothetical protein
MSQVTPWTDVQRERIKAGELIEALTEHALGLRKMTTSQVTAALGLIKKRLPDLVAVELNGNLEHRNVVSAEPLTEQQWAERNSATR